jgi:hypothetical protein
MGPLFFSLCLSAPVIVFHAYYLRLQTYVLRLDIIIQSIAQAFVAAEAMFSFSALLSFWRAQRF